ncbi:LysM peptidoglycan-binding domain-containing protein [Sphingobium nicotianae]|uniref:LysM peptidoglycan-binding domain-containing protein n=1 Tax=Sphingobium nicotianae TaxID=2782607 RepID=A0A9X1IS88_9SPHN|nr:DNA/RNA non-specific endonuclease [Sphingobium nicotianae]MBT2187905.1 LysM peptidoglycan-binding domain-containing protein [Sphingobium nicotianae]
MADSRYASTYTVRPGDNLSRIAANRKGLSADSLAWVNGIPVNGTLRVGQKLRVPTQAWLDANRVRARDTFGRVGGLGMYLGTHNGELPIPRSPDDPSFRDIDTAHPPSISEQLSAKVQTIELNGYRYSIDRIGRVQNVHGEIPSEAEEKRSRKVQAEAGGKDRLRTDDGGHYIASRFGGAPVPINHFPQDSGINRGQYRVIENQWDEARKAGKRVTVDITPHYSGASLRPDRLDVVWYIDGKKYRQMVGNHRRSK